MSARHVTRSVISSVVQLLLVSVVWLPSLMKGLGRPVWQLICKPLIEQKLQAIKKKLYVVHPADDGVVVEKIHLLVDRVTCTVEWMYIRPNAVVGETILESGRSTCSSCGRVSQRYAATINPFASVEGQAPVKRKPLVLVLPGNPGLVHFYRTFLKSIYTYFDCEVECQCISYSGHIQHTDDTEFNRDAKIYDFHFQIAMMKQFCRQIINNNPTVELILVGHSVGSYVALQLLDEIPTHNLLSIHLLCPTIHNIGLSPNGRRMSFLLHHTRPVFGFLAYLLSMLPAYLSLMVLSLHIGRASSADILHASLHMLNKTVVENCMYMASSELRHIRDLQYDLIMRYLHKLYICFAHSDEWCSKQQQQEIRHAFPKARITMLHETILHAFVIGHSEPVAKIVHQQVMEMKEKQQQQFQRKHHTTSQNAIH